MIPSAATTGDKNERRRNQRADKAASAAALLQHAISDDRFAAAVQELETSFGAKFSEFITGSPPLMLAVAWLPHAVAVHLLQSLKAPSCIQGVTSSYACMHACIQCAPAKSKCAKHVLLAYLFWVRVQH